MPVPAWIEQLAYLRNLWISGQIPEWGIWSYLVLALVVAVEGPVATLLGAAAASAGVMRPIPVFIAAALGNLTADTLWYLVGKLGKMEWFFKIGERFGLSRQHMQRLQQNMRDHAVKILFFAKLSMSLMIPSLLAAGLIKAPWRRWFPAVFGGEIIWTGALVLIGYYATEAIKRIEPGLEYLLLAGSIAFVIFMFVLSRRILRESEKAEDAETTPEAMK